MLKKLFLIVLLSCATPAHPQVISGVVASWGLDGNLSDISGNGFSGSFVGSPTPATDRFGNPNAAYSFNGATQFIRFGDILDSVFSRSPAAQFSISCWIRPNTTNNGFYLAKSSGGTGPYQWHMHIGTDGKAGAAVISSATGPANWIEKKASVVVTTNTWHHVVLTFDGSQPTVSNRVQFYFNNNLGVLGTTNGTLGLTTANTNQEITVGASHVINNPTSPANVYSGAVDDINIFNRVLTTQEIAYLYNYQPFMATFYSKSSGALNDLSTWGTNTDGSGTTPGSFNDSFNLFVVANNTAPAISGNWNVTGNGSEIRFGTGSNTFNLIIPASNTISAPTVRVRQNVTITVLGELMTSSGTNDTLSTVQYIGSGPQVIAPLTYYALTIAGGDKSLSVNTNVRENFNMAGRLNTGNNILILGTSSTQKGTLNYSSGTLIGRMSRWYGTANNSGNTGLFPLGTTSTYRPISIEYTSPPATGGILTCEFVSSSPGTAGLPQFDFSITPSIFISKAGVNGFWRVMSSNGLSGGLYTVTVTPSGFSGINNYQQLRLLNRTTLGGSWSITGTAIAPTGSNLSPVLSRTGQSGTNEFAVGGDETINPLPVNFVGLSGTRNGKDIIISWATASESNVNGFAVLRGERMGFLETIGIVDAKGNSGTGQHYAYRDNNVVESGKPYYYQIAEVGENGFGDRSPVIVVNNANMEEEPAIELLGGNPVSTNIVSLNARHPVKYTLFDLGGKTLLTGKTLGAFSVILPTNGLYFLRAIDEKTGKTTIIKVAY